MRDCLTCAYLSDPLGDYKWHSCTWISANESSFPNCIKVTPWTVSVQEPERDCPAWKERQPQKHVSRQTTEKG